MDSPPPPAMDLQKEVEIKYKIQQLYQLRDKEHTANKLDKQAKLQSLMTETRAQIPDPASSQSGEERAKLYYYHGKVLDCLPSYTKEAEDCLSKALKNDPSNMEAWLTLGHVYWKKEKLEEALNCFRSAEELEPKGKEPLREVARVLRLLGKDRNERTENVEAAVEKAKKAVAADVKDGASWYVLGNCLLSHFMATSSNPDDMAKAHKAYCQAEAHGEDHNPDLHFNKAIIAKYKADYEAAHAGFARAHSFDPSLQEATHEIRTVKLFLNYMADKLAFKGGLPTRTLDRQLQGIKGPGATVTCQNKPYTLVPLASLLEGAPAAAGSEGPVAVCVYVLHMISRSVDAPLVYVVCDNAKTAVALTVYNVSTHAVKEGDEVVIPSPSINHCCFTLGGNIVPAVEQQSDNHSTTSSGSTKSDVLNSNTSYDYHNVSVWNARAVLVNNKKIPAERFLKPQLTVTAFT